METVLSFLGGLILSAIVAIIVTRRIVRTRVEQAEQSTKMLVESGFNVEKANLESELRHANERAEDLLTQLEEEKVETERQVREERAQAEENLKKRLEEKQEETERLRQADDLRHQAAIKSQQEMFDKTIAELKVQVKSATEDMLQERQKEFSESSNVSLGQIVNPLKENIAELKKAMEQGNKEQAERNGEMRERIKSLMEHSDAARKSAEELAAAFKHGSKMQGDWGETILEELLTAQGLTRGIHFDIQATICDEDGKTVRNTDGSIMRPDVILHLDAKREVIIDSKVSLTAYVDYVNAENEMDRQAYLKAHIESIKKHVNELVKKNYSSYIQPPKVSAGYVIMFVPNMGALWTALNAEPTLWRRAADANVYIADEQSLYGALKIVNMTWTQVAQAQNHEEVYKLANEMIDRVGMFLERYNAIGKALEKAQSEYELGLTKLDSKGQSIINTSSKLIKLGAKNSDKHPIKGLIDIEEIPGLPMANENNGDFGQES